ncbi:MAG: hypothetical protein RDU20_23565 [Desulfomonilaceae bacterium]|nr:hypothetical protein [Desulfomonilaceae bacterium]
MSTLGTADQGRLGIRGRDWNDGSEFGSRTCTRSTGFSGNGRNRRLGSRLGTAIHRPAIFILTVILCMWFPSPTPADWFDDSPPAWEPLLWGGKVENERPHLSENAADETDIEKITRVTGPTVYSPLHGSAIPRPSLAVARDYYRAPFRVLSLRNIPPLYSSPVLPGEGVWEWRDMPVDSNGWPVVYRTSYRPSVEYPNAIVHMLLFDMKRISMRLYVGSTEPGGSRESAMITPDDNPHLIAVTNALWKQRHSGDAGTVFRGTVIKDLAPGVATLVVYKDGSVDILEWNETIPTSLVHDAKQLRHLIVKDGRVVTGIVQDGRMSDSEIGLGYLLTENPPDYPVGPWGGYWGSPQPMQTMHTSGPEWFIATRSAFGIRSDGNLVFAAGHHISTKDLAKALALAGCRRAIHGDANPHNVLGNLYYSDGDGGIARKAKLSPDQRSDTVNRYIGRSYSSDFFGFFLRGLEKDS